MLIASAMHSAVLTGAPMSAKEQVLSLLSNHPTRGLSNRLKLDQCNNNQSRYSKDPYSRSRDLCSRGQSRSNSIQLYLTSQYSSNRDLFSSSRDLFSSNHDQFSSNHDQFSRRDPLKISNRVTLFLLSRSRSPSVPAP